MKNFDVIIGNPPYQRPKHQEGNHNNKPMWLSFLKLYTELLKKDGYVSVLVPGQVVKSTQWNQPGKGLKALEGLNITALKTGEEQYFDVASTISRVSGFNGQKQRKILVNGEIIADLSKRPWLPAVQCPEAYSILDKVSSLANNFEFVIQTSAYENKQHHGVDTSFGMYRMNHYYGYKTYLRCDREEKNLLWLSMECENKQKAEGLRDLMRSKLFTALRRITFFEPNTSFGILNGFTYNDDCLGASDDEIYSIYGLTTSEIAFVESLQKKPTR